LRLIRRLAVRMLDAVVRRARPEAREWGTAMLREMDLIESDWPALFWAMGGAKSVMLRGKGMEMMPTQKINRVSGWIIMILSSIALLMVMSGYFQAPQADEGAAAHIFQLSIVALVPMILLFLATADWKQPLRSMRRMMFPATALVLAFGALYYLEHYR
jgi:hypothetical protein